MNKNAIIIIGTGRYLLLAVRLISKINLAYIDKQFPINFHLFSDQNPKLSAKNVFFHQVSEMDWTTSTLYRFSAAKIIIGMGYDNILYIDADTNLRSNDKLYFNDLFCGSLFAIDHPDKNNNHYEERVESAAFINPEERYIYYMACLYGGNLKIFSNLIDDAKKRLDLDLENKIIARAEDESYVQPFLNKNRAKITPLADKIILSDKGVGDDRLMFWGKFLDMNLEWPDDIYYNMLDNAIKMTNNSVAWDIKNKNIILT